MQGLFRGWGVGIWRGPVGLRAEYQILNWAAKLVLGLPLEFAFFFLEEVLEMFMFMLSKKESSGVN